MHVNNPTVLHLRAMNIMYEAIKAKGFYISPAEQVGPPRNGGINAIRFGRSGQSGIRTCALKERVHAGARLAQNRSMANVVGSRETFPRAFPALTEEQIDRIRPLGRMRQVRSGDILFKPGDTAVPFYVLMPEPV